MSLAVCACGDTKEEPVNVADLETQSQDGDESVPEDDNETEGFMADPEADKDETNKVTVTYDENTLFTVKTIYDGGARSEMTEATSLSLAADQLVEVWGDSSGSELKATQICIVKVELRCTYSVLT